MCVTHSNGVRGGKATKRSRVWSLREMLRQTYWFSPCLSLPSPFSIGQGLKAAPSGDLEITASYLNCHLYKSQTGPGCLRNGNNFTLGVI